MIRIFEVENGTVKLTEHCYLIKELKALIDKYEDYMPVIKYVYLLTAPDSPFANMREDEKLEAISDEVGGDFTLDDEEIDAAIQKLNKLYETPITRIYNGLIKSIDGMAHYLANTTIEPGRDGNDRAIDAIQNNMSKKIESLRKLEKMKDEEQKTNMRGKAQMGEY